MKTIIFIAIALNVASLSDAKPVKEKVINTTDESYDAELDGPFIKDNWGDDHLHDNDEKPSPKARKSKRK